MSATKVIRPATVPLDAVVRPPGSKSLTIRALVAASLAPGISRIISPLESDDTRFALEAVRALGIEVRQKPEAWLVHGTGGRLTPSVRPLDAGASGLTARILIAMSALVNGVTVIVGRDRLPERPMDGIVKTLQSLGIDIRSSEGLLPVEVFGTGLLPGGLVGVDTTQSTQFATAMALVAPLAADPLTIDVGGSTGASGYLDLTLGIMDTFGLEASMVGGSLSVPNSGYRATTVSIEPDASAAVYPMVAAALVGGKVVVEDLGISSIQPDLRVARVLEEMGCAVQMDDDIITVTASGGVLNSIDVDLSGSPDGALALAVACLRAAGPCRLRGLGSLRHKESDRLTALATELSRVGAGAEIIGDDLEIRPGRVSPAVIETYSDHRMAMSFAILGLVHEGIAIAHPEVVSKTWPGFWKMLDSLSD